MDTTPAPRHEVEVEVDTEIQAAEGAYAAAIAQRNRIGTDIARVQGTLADGSAAYRRGGEDGARAEIERLRTEGEAVSITVGTTRARLDAAQERYTGWTRYYYAKSANGHVHATMSCSTCNNGAQSTRFVWLVDHSGATPEELVELAGETACTTCFPWAPVDTLKRRTRLELRTPEQIAEQEAKAAEKAKRAAAKAAKAITNPDGTELRDHFGLVLATERAAQTAYTGHLADADRGYGYNADYAERLLVALAHKSGVTVEDKRAELEPKVEAKIKQDRRG